MTTAATVQAEIQEAIAALEADARHEDIRLIRLDLDRAGSDIRELMMVRDDAERLAGLF